MRKEGSIIKDVMDKENIQQGCKLPKTFGSILGDIGLCMVYFEGSAVLFGKLLDRYESETFASSFDPNLLI
jgi:hypothetical protein